MEKLVKLKYGNIRTSYDYWRCILQRKCEPVKVKSQWLQCILWDDKALKEIKAHHEIGSILHTHIFIGKMMHNCVLDNDPDYFGMLTHMDYAKPFVLFDIVGDTYKTCGSKKCIRVQETHTWNNSHVERKPKLWDLVIFDQCTELGEEMIRMQSQGVKTTVAIWNCCIDRYTEPWVNEDEEVLGEVFLRPTADEGKILTVLVFHQQTVQAATMPQPITYIFKEDEGCIRSYFNITQGKDTDGLHLAFFFQKTFEKDEECPELIKTLDEHRRSVAGTPSGKEPDHKDGSEEPVPSKEIDPAPSKEVDPGPSKENGESADTISETCCE